MPLDTTTRILAPFLDRLTVEELDAIPYGIIQLDPTGAVLSYNRTEREQAGRIPRPLGQDFFQDVCPGARIPAFFGRFQDGVRDEKLDETFSFTFTCPPSPRRVLVRMYYSVRSKSVWVFVAKPDGSPLTAPAVAA
jgi:photoactive yellow protein